MKDFSSQQVDFTSNDYLGFARHPELKARIMKRIGTEAEFLGSTGSRLLAGHQTLMGTIEQKISNFLHADSGLIFNSGYDANLGLFASLLKENDVIIYDEWIHASVRDGVKLSGCSRFTFRHNNLQHLEKRLKAQYQSLQKLQTLQTLPIDADSNLDLDQKFDQQKKRIFVAVESIYSMDGDCAPLREIADLCEQYQAVLIVDEAHATGVYGTKGEGLVVELGLEEKVWARVHTFGKALGVHGAMIVGPEILIQYLINFCRPFIYTTALPLHSFLMIDEAFNFLSTSEYQQLKIKLKQNIEYLKKRLPQLNTPHLPGPIFPLAIKHREQLLTIANELKNQGIQIHPIMSPTVPRGQERLRLSLHAFNTFDEIDQACEIYQQLMSVKLTTSSTEAINKD